MEGCGLQFITPSLRIHSVWLSERTKEKAYDLTPIQRLDNKMLQKNTSKMKTEPSVISKYKFGEYTHMLWGNTHEKYLFLNMLY